jgi:hypothetical protein
MAFGGAGIGLSGGFFDQAGPALEKCFDQAPWTGGPGGDWVLFQCLKRLGVPLTAGGGFHQVSVLLGFASYRLRVIARLYGTPQLARLLKIVLLT